LSQFALKYTDLVGALLGFVAGRNAHNVTLG
jgi:hypothetical protein